MERLTDLSSIYRNIMNSAFSIKVLFLNSLEDDKLIEKYKFLLDCFYNFNLVNFDSLKLSMVNDGIPISKIEEVIGYLNILKEAQYKYNINNIDEISLLILDEWQNNRNYSDQLVRDILVIEFENQRNRNLPHSNIHLFDIYKEMVDCDMLNPNLHIWNGYNLYTMLPDDISCYQHNLKVIANPTVDWSIYRNGSNPLECFCFDYNNSKSEEERRYYHDLIITAINSSCSLFNNKFAWHIPTHKTEEMINYFLLAEKNAINSGRHSINDIGFSKEINSLLLTDKLFDHQLGLYNEKNKEADEIIKQLKLKRENK